MTFLTVDRRGRNTLPEEVRQDLGIADQETSFVLLEKTSRGTYELVPASLVPNDQLWFHHPEMQDRMARAEADFREGRSTQAATPEEAQSFLDGLKKGRLGDGPESHIPGRRVLGPLQGELPEAFGTTAREAWTRRSSRS